MAGYYRLEQWSVCGGIDPYAAPEIDRKRLQGNRNDGKFVVTGPIVKANGREITTWSGSVYVLGEIDPEYLTWMEGEGMLYIPEAPIKFREK